MAKFKFKKFVSSDVTFKEIPQGLRDIAEKVLMELVMCGYDKLSETKGDYYQKLNTLNVLAYGTKDENPRPIYESDGAPAHTFSINHVVNRYDLSTGDSPMVTLRNTAVKAAIKEIFWIYQMQSNKISDLHDLGINYWDQWDVGDGTIGCRYGATIKRHKLIDKLLKGLVEDPFGRRHIMCMWQEDDFSDETGGTTKGLNPCCYETIWNVRKVDRVMYLDMLLNQRSSDYTVSCAINEIQYVALMMMVAQHCGYELGNFTHVIENLQIYDRHVNQVLEMLDRSSVLGDIYEQPVLTLESDTKSLFDIKPDDFQMKNYPRKRINEINPQLKFDLGI